jgi:DNA-binding transcriptional ArsR family regulator
VPGVFHALAAPARRAILDELHDRDGQTLFELCSRLTMKHGLGLSRQAISQHLAVLESAGLVRSKARGQIQVPPPRPDAIESDRGAVVK